MKYWTFIALTLYTFVGYGICQAPTETSENVTLSPQTNKCLDKCNGENPTLKRVRRDGYQRASEDLDDALDQFQVSMKFNSSLLQWMCRKMKLLKCTQKCLKAKEAMGKWIGNLEKVCGKQKALKEADKCLNKKAFNEKMTKKCRKMLYDMVIDKSEVKCAALSALRDCQGKMALEECGKFASLYVQVQRNIEINKYELSLREGGEKVAKPCITQLASEDKQYANSSTIVIPLFGWHIGILAAFLLQFLKGSR
ncbi:hypothetical protein Ddc_03923 [Ditylenchus destructor]|nr:hypothetical protein Ddc_03923 [Ditylenchus destructor]